MVDGGLVHIGEILSSFEGLRPRLSEYRVWKAWREVVGDKVAERAQPMRLKGGTLYVRVTSSSWMQELSLFKDRIVKGLNESLGKGVVEDIVFRIGKAGRGPVKERKRPPSQLPDSTVRWIEEVLLPVKDEELKGVLRRILSKDAAVKLYCRKD